MFEVYRGIHIAMGMVALVSFYLALTGYTVLRRKTPEDRFLDRVAAALFDDFVV